MDMLLHGEHGARSTEEQPTLKAICNIKNAGTIIAQEIQEEAFRFFVADVVGFFAILLFWER